MLLRSLSLITLCAAVHAQPKPLSFDAAEIKPVKPAGDARVSGDYQHGRVIVHNATLHMLINTAYSVRFDHIKAGPGWIDSDLFDVSAKADPATTEADSRLMLRTLLEEQFHLAVHHEAKPTAVYGLTVAKGGPKFQKTPEGATDKWGCYGEPVVCHRTMLSELANMLPSMTQEIDREVVDFTGLEGRYDIPLSKGRRLIFDSLAAAGLRLEPRKHDVDYLVIDRADR